jgi:hypothetical protein
MLQLCGKKWRGILNQLTLISNGVEEDSFHDSICRAEKSLASKALTPAGYNPAIQIPMSVSVVAPSLTPEGYNR